MASPAGCGGNPYSFKEPIDEIESIEIVSAENSLEFTVLKTLSEEEKEDFLERFQTMEFHKYLGVPSLSKEIVSSSLKEDSHVTNDEPPFPAL